MSREEGRAGWAVGPLRGGRGRGGRRAGDGGCGLFGWFLSFTRACDFESDWGDHI